MKVRLILMACLLFVNLFAETTNPTTINTDKKVYTPNERIVVHISNVLGDKKDWIAIYPLESNPDWSNVIQWQWLNGIHKGDVKFKGLAEGKYEVRVFFKNTYDVEASQPFDVKAKIEEKVVLKTDKESYSTENIISIDFENMSGHLKDWIAIYPQKSNNDWKNVLAWKYTEGKKNAKVSFDALAEGDYEVRAFFKNSYKLESKHFFSVKAINSKVKLSMKKNSYFKDEEIVIDFSNMSGDKKDWLGIYKKSESNEWKNILHWHYTAGLKEGTMKFEALEIGSYEVRAFFKDSLKDEMRYEFDVIPENISSTVYEDGENGISDKWIHYAGNHLPIHVNEGFESNGSVALATEWTNNGTLNLAQYYLPLNNTKQKVLEADIGGLANFKLPNKSEGYEGYMSHFGIGVTVHTKNGKRKLIWDSFLNHGNVEAYRQDYGNGNIWMYFPSPVEHVRGYLNIDIHDWEHFRVDVEKALKKFEPDNKITSIDYLLVTGGFLDNIKLSSK